MFVAWFTAAAREPCPPTEPAATSRTTVLQAAERALEGYRGGDVRVVDAARCDIEAGLAMLREPLGPGDAARIHLAYAAAARMTGEAPEAVGVYLASARHADAWLDRSLEVLVGPDDPLVALARSDGAGTDPEERLAPAWAGEVRVDGVRASHAPSGPYVLQLVGRDAGTDRSWYVDGGAAVPAYLHKRPVIAGMAVGTTVAAGVSLGLAARSAIRGARYQAEQSLVIASRNRISGSDLVAVQAEVERYRTRNELARGAAAGFGLVTVGLGVWYATTF